MTTRDDEGGDASNLTDQGEIGETPRKAVNLDDFRAKKGKGKKDNKGSNEPATTAKGPRKGGLFRLVTKIMNGIQEGKNPLPAFPNRFLVIRDLLGFKQILEVSKNDVVKIISLDDVSEAILNYAEDILGHMEIFEWTVKETNECAAYWLKRTKPAEEPIAIVRWADEPGLCYNRMTWGKIESLEKPYCPDWDHQFSRIEHNAQAAMDALASLFYDDAYNQQYLWLDGTGGDGKGAILNFLNRIFGKFYFPAFPPNKDAEPDRFLWHVHEARVLAFDDVKHMAMPTWSWFMSLIGGVNQLIKGHHKKAVSASLNMMPIITANGEPILSSEPSDMRRAIYVKFRPREALTIDESYYDRLYEQGGAFLAKIRAHYELNYQKKPVASRRPPIKVDGEALEEVIESGEMIFDSLFNAHFRMAGTKNDGTKERIYVIKEVLHQFMIDNFVNDPQQRRKFDRYLKNKRGMVYDHIRLNEDDLKCHPNAFFDENGKRKEVGDRHRVYRFITKLHPIYPHY